MAEEHDEFLALKALEKWPAARIAQLKESIIEQAERTGNRTVEVKLDGTHTDGFVKVEKKAAKPKPVYQVTDWDALSEWERDNTRQVEDIDLDAIADLPRDLYDVLLDFVAGRMPWCIRTEEEVPTIAEYDHVGSTVLWKTTGEIIPGVEWVEDKEEFSYTVKAVEANKSGNPGTKVPALESVAKSIGGSFRALTDGSMFALEGEVE